MKLIKVIVVTIVKIRVRARTKRGKTLFEYRIKGSPLPPLWGQGRHYRCAERLLWVKSQGIMPGIMSLFLPEAFILISILAKGCVHTQGSVPG